MRTITQLSSRDVTVRHCYRGTWVVPEGQTCEQWLLGEINKRSSVHSAPPNLIPSATRTFPDDIDSTSEEMLY